MFNILGIEKDIENDPRMSNSDLLVKQKNNVSVNFYKLILFLGTVKAIKGNSQRDLNILSNAIWILL